MLTVVDLELLLEVSSPLLVARTGSVLSVTQKGYMQAVHQGLFAVFGGPNSLLDV